MFVLLETMNILSSQSLLFCNSFFLMEPQPYLNIGFYKRKRIDVEEHADVTDGSGMGLGRMMFLVVCTSSLAFFLVMLLSRNCPG